MARRPPSNDEIAEVMFAVVSALEIRALPGGPELLSELRQCAREYPESIAGMIKACRCLLKVPEDATQHALRKQGEAMPRPADVIPLGSRA